MDTNQNNTSNKQWQRDTIQASWQEHAPDLNDEIILKVKNLKQHFPIRQGFFQRVVGHIKAVDGVSFFIREEEVLGLVGESGCGKTTLGRTILRLYDPTAGEIWFRTHQGDWVDLAQLSHRAVKPLRREMRMIFQDPFSSLNPRFTVKDIIGEPLIIHGIAAGKAKEDRVAQLMTSVGLDPTYMRRYPHEFSGGQRQRIGLARTLALSPRLIVADEPVSALDVSIQAQVLNLLQELKDELGLTLLFVAHDLSVVEHICDRIAVMYVGKIVEMAESEALLRHPLHPYTEALVSAVPPADPDIKLDRIILDGDVPSPANPPAGCVFHPRCRYAKDICRHEEPQLVEVESGRFVSCHLATELQLQGVGG
jgi:oligopeptide/dipeptide ABC transporter ATP-binding protein